MKNRIKKIRTDARLTQTMFGEKIGVKGNTITNYENGLRNPTDAVILSICREFNINEEWLRDGTGEMYVPKTRDDEISEFVGRMQNCKSDTFKARFISMLSRLDENDWEVLEKMANEMANKKSE